MEMNEFLDKKITRCIKLLNSTINNDGSVADSTNVFECLSELKLASATLNGMIDISDSANVHVDKTN